VQNIYVALENLRSLYNIGAIFRTCSYFGIYKVLLVGYSGKRTNTKGEVILHHEVEKSSLGSEKDLQITMLKDSKELIDYAAANSLKVVAVEQHHESIDLESFVIPNNSVLVFGNEVDGVSPETLKNSNCILEIKRPGKHNSLNVTTACGIILYKASILREH
jgi:23S rRNA (guanosine2251-2'-O)-methyltransferase